MTTKGVALITSECEATGHPDECSEPAPGTVENDSGSHNVTVKTSSGEYMVATKKIAVMNFPSHAHDYSELEGCHEEESHAIDPRESSLLSIKIDGSKVYPVENDVQEDPNTGEAINIVSSEGSVENTS